jgi:cell division protein FtsN
MPDHSTSSADYAEPETEIVLGNKQLFSLLFVVFVLLGVFFAMGYVMGRSTVPADVSVSTGQTAHAATDTTASQPITVPTKPPAMGGEPPSAEKPEAEPTSAPATKESPAQGATSPVASKPAARPAQEQEPAAGSRVVEPALGQTFLQVAAINRRPEAEILVDVLRKKGFQAAIEIAPGNVFRVLVGPAKDKDEAADLRAKLEAAGFKPWVRHY